MTTIDLTNTIDYPRLLGVPTSRVWTKPTWADAFTLRPDMVAIQSVSSVAPEVPTATIEYRYGRVLLPGATDVVDLVPITARGYWVLIEWVFDTREWWFGYAESPVTTRLRAGAGFVPAAGIQRVPCYGLERVLEINRIGSTVHTNPDPDAEENTARSLMGSIFNRDEIGNRDPDDAINAFAHQVDTERWNTRQIVDHLLRYHLPSPSGEAGVLPWAAPDLSAIPDWEEPTVPTDGRTVAEVLNDLLNSASMLGWRVVPVIAETTPPAVSALNFTPFSRASAAITLPDVGTIPANTSQVTLVGADADPLTDAELVEDDADIVDQVIVYGPREIAVATFAIDAPIERRWSSARETEYATGGSEEAGYAGMSQHEQRRLDDEARRDAAVRTVFREFRWPDDWDGLGNQSTKVFEPIDEDTPHVPYLENVEILDRLPLYDEIDYAGDVSAVDESAGRVHRDPMYLLLRPGSETLYETIESAGVLPAGLPPETASVSYAVAGRTTNDVGIGIELHVSGGPQHAIAGPDFAGTVADVDQDSFGGYDYSTLLTTAALRGNRRPFFAVPSNEDLASVDVVRRRVVILEDSALQHVYLADGTIVGLLPGGVPRTSDGGVLRDPGPKIEAICRTVAASLTVAKKRVSMRTQRRLPIAAGSMIAAIDGAAVGAMVLEVRVDAPSSERDARPDGATVTVTAATHRADVLRLMRPTR